MTDNSNLIPDLGKVEIEILIKDPSYRDATTGETYAMPEWMDWKPAKTAPTETCEHGETMCGDCADEWATDWWIRIRAGEGPWSTLNGAPGYPSL